jgi:hypothetical protein
MRTWIVRLAAPLVVSHAQDASVTGNLFDRDEAGVVRAEDPVHTTSGMPYGQSNTPNVSRTASRRVEAPMGHRGRTDARLGSAAASIQPHIDQDMSVPVPEHLKDLKLAETPRARRRHDIGPAWPPRRGPSASHRGSRRLRLLNS